MKKIISIILFLSIWGSAFSQNLPVDTSKNNFFRNEIRINLNYFLGLFKNQTDLPYTTSVSLSGNHFINDKTFMRFDVGFGYTLSDTKKDTVPHAKYKDLEQSYGIGLGRELKISKRFAFYYGGEADFQPTYNETNQPISSSNGTGFVMQTTSARNLYYGGTIFMGVKIYLFSRISLSTETKADLLFSKSTNKTQYDLTPALNTTSTTNGFSTAYYLPATIYLNVRLGKNKK